MKGCLRLLTESTCLDDSKSRSPVLDDLENDLNQCIQWAIDNQMTYNLDKIQFIIFGRKTDSVLLFGDFP